MISENVPDELRKLREETDGDILVAGSVTLVKTLLENDLVDELRLMVFPTILGSGKRLFPDGIDRLKLKLTDDRTVGKDGVMRPGLRARRLGGALVSAYAGGMLWFSRKRLSGS